jgi:hypothetical protein
VGDLVREIISNGLNDLLDRLDALRYRLAQSRFYKADQRIAFALAVAALLGFGVLAATAVGRSGDETPYVAPSNAGRASSSPVSSSSRTDVVTETVRRQGRTVRLVRQRASTTVQDVVTLPAHTVRETHTVTTRDVATVTAIQAVTVTVVETVTCKPKEC